MWLLNEDLLVWFLCGSSWRSGSAPLATDPLAWRSQNWPKISSSTNSGSLCADKCLFRLHTFRVRERREKVQNSLNLGRKWTFDQVLISNADRLTERHMSWNMIPEIIIIIRRLFGLKFGPWDSFCWCGRGGGEGRGWPATNHLGWARFV